MTLSDLIKKVGDENIHVQFLSECLAGIKERKKLGCTEVSFLTDAVTTDTVVKNTSDIGVIIWIPKDKWPHEKD